MVSLKLQKRLAASVLKCGQHKIWSDPNEINEIPLANSHRNITCLHKDGLNIKKPAIVHSCACVAFRNKAKRKGQHTLTNASYLCPLSSSQEDGSQCKNKPTEVGKGCACAKLARKAKKGQKRAAESSE
eukprot:2115056-Ditylum_brightwellii.AAC.1